MAQVTADFCDHMDRASDRDEVFPLTINEQRQLAHLARQQIRRNEQELRNVTLTYPIKPVPR